MENKNVISFGKLNTSHRIRAATATVTNRISYGITGKAGKNRISPQITILIGEFYMSEAGLLPGDRVDILFYKEDHLGIIKRIVKGCPGFNITTASNKERGKIHFTFREGMPYYKSRISLNSIEVKNGEIYFEFPPEDIK